MRLFGFLSILARFDGSGASVRPCALGGSSKKYSFWWRFHKARFPRGMNLEASQQLCDSTGFLRFV